MKKTIFLKIFWAGVLVLVSAVVLISLFTFSSLKRWHRDDLQGHLQQLGRSLRPAVMDKLIADPTALDPWIKRMDERIKSRISIIAPDGRVLADSRALPQSMDNHRDRPEIAAAMTGTPSSRQRFSRTLMADMLYVALPLRADSEIVGVLRVSMTMETIRSLRRELEVRIIIILISLLLLSFLLTYINSRRISKPIRRLALAARTVAGGDFTPRVYISDRGELGDLATSFNRMVSRQSELFSRMARQQEQLQTLFATMREALAVIAIDGTVRMCNKSFLKMVHDSNPQGKKYWEILRCSEFYDTIQDLTVMPRNHSGEMEFEERDYLVNFTPLPAKDEFVVTFLDITERRRLETIKRDFVGNVSHELKTPLTSIKGFLEILEAEIEHPEGKRYLDIIHRNADRMIHIIQDLLLLSRMEDKNFHLDAREVNLPMLIGNTARMFETAINDKGLELILDIPADLPPITGDAARLEDMLVNLLDNAVKYTERGSITISVRGESSWAEIRVSDTGIGIPPGLLERIFERFFVVDASRSKETGGTGLGLSIVKHIVLLHNGEISVDSAPNRGTTFIVRLPLDSSKSS